MKYRLLPPEAGNQHEPMRGSRSYSVLFWIVWTVTILLAQAGQVDGSEYRAMAAGLSMSVLPVTVYSWCKADAAARSVQPPPGAIPLLAVLLPLGWAYYVFATRPPLRAFGLIIGAALVSTGILAVTAIVCGPDTLA